MIYEGKMIQIIKSLRGSDAYRAGFNDCKEVLTDILEDTFDLPGTAYQFENWLNMQINIKFTAFEKEPGIQHKLKEEP